MSEPKWTVIDESWSTYEAWYDWLKSQVMAMGVPRQSLNEIKVIVDHDPGDEDRR